MLILVNVRVPLTRGKTTRQVLKEQGLWEENKQGNAYDPTPGFDKRDAVGTVPMTKDSEVSVLLQKNKRLQGYVRHVLNSV